jgi:hypothetical protein
MIFKLYFNFTIKLLTNAADLTYCGLIFYSAGGLSIGYFPMVQVLIG